MDGFRCFTWDRSHFPDPAALVDWLHEKGFKVVSMIDPGIKQDENYWVYQQMVNGSHFCKDKDGQDIFIGDVWPGACGFPDFTRSETREWWGTLYKSLVEDDHVDGFWNDMNEPAIFHPTKKTMPDWVVHSIGKHDYVHNLYGMLMVRASYEGLCKLQPERRHFILSRAGFAGVQKYAWMWTGDNKSTWEDLGQSIPVCLNVGISGQPGCGVDIGGFALNPTGELYARWIQLGAFLPLSRTHTSRNTLDQEPWSYGEEVEQVARQAIKLRYRFLAYLYTWMEHASRTGVPLMRPLWMNFPQDSNCFNKEWEDSQFLIGPHLLVAPVIVKGATSRRVYLPKFANSNNSSPSSSSSSSSGEKGIWWNFHTKDKYEGGQVITVESPLDSCVPLFVKDGTVLPLFKQTHIGRNVADLMQSKKSDGMNEGLEFVTFAEVGEEDKARGLLYEDDGESMEFKTHNNYALWELSHQGKAKLLRGQVSTV